MTLACQTRNGCILRTVLTNIAFTIVIGHANTAQALYITLSDGASIYAAVLNNTTSPLPPGITHPDLLPVDPDIPENRFTVDQNNTEVLSFSFNHPDYYIFGNVSNFTDGAYYGNMISDFGVISKTASEVSGSISIGDILNFPPPDSSRPGRPGFIGETLTGRFIYPDFFGTCLQNSTCSAHIFTTSVGGTNVNFGLDTSILTNPFNAKESGVLPSNFDPPYKISGAGSQGLLDFSVKGIGTIIVINSAKYYLDDSDNTFDSTAPQWGLISPWENGTFGVLGENDLLGAPGDVKAPWLDEPPWGTNGMPPWEGSKNDPNPWGFASNAPEPSTLGLLGLGLAISSFLTKKARAKCLLSRKIGDTEQ